MDGVETIEFQGDWVILDGRRMILKEKVQYIRADRKLPSEISGRKQSRRAH